MCSENGTMIGGKNCVFWRFLGMISKPVPFVERGIRCVIYDLGWIARKRRNKQHEMMAG
jgi:hypothetical protein